MSVSRTPASAIVQKVWNYAHVLKDDGLAFMDYTEQITYLLFLKMAWERRSEGISNIPARYTWGALQQVADKAKRLERYHQGLRKLSEEKGLLGLIFTKPQSKITDPAKLHLLMQMIDTEDWSALDVDVKGEVYEGLLARNADDVRGGAGQYFTPRPVIRAIVDVMQPTPQMRIADPACGTGGFLLAAFEYLQAHAKTAAEKEHVRRRSLRGCDLVPNVARLCAMNLFLHGVEADPNEPAVTIGDSLETAPERVEMVLTNPPFGKKSSVTIVGNEGKTHTDRLSYKRSDFWVTTSNKQLNFIQHVYSMLKAGGRAAMVVPDNVLFESGAGERIRRNLLERCDVHTLLRLPTGIWYSTGVKANVLFFDKPEKGKKAGTRELWVYDLRQRTYSLRSNPIRAADLEDFVQCYEAADRTRRRETPRFRKFTHDEVSRRDRANIDLRWEESAADLDRETPQALMASIMIDLQDAMKEFASVEDTIRNTGPERHR
jgi:type I restriction enzyme M protein